jgi:glycosyltransferase involved in cell wall biosynthesis
MADLTVSMPAYNAGPYIRQAIDSVLCQEDIDLELIVVDDHSTDHTTDIVASYEDARMRLVRNPQQRGIGYCHNVVLRESRSRFIAHVDADDFLLPGALRKLVAAVASDINIGQAHCHFFDVDALGRISREAFRERWVQFSQNRPPHLDYKQNLIRGRNLTNHLRTYPRTVLEELGGFNEALHFGVDYDMALRLLDRYTIRLVPEFLYCRRLHRGNTTESLRFKLFRFQWQMYQIRQQLVREKKVRFLPNAWADCLQIVGARSLDAWNNLKTHWSRIVQRVATFLTWRIQTPVSLGLYRALGHYLSWWPLGLFPVRTSIPPAAEKRIAYYHHAFPILSETFIQREILALRRSGLRVEVLAHAARDEEYLDDQARQLMGTTHYLDPMDARQLAAYRWRFLRRHPFTYSNLFLYVVLRRHSERKSYQADRELFNRAVYVAGVLQDKGITHIHSPWASLDALVALLAARLARISYTVQGRASDLHRHSTAYDLQEKFIHAQFIVTNARFNASVIQPLLPKRCPRKLYTIYEGIDLGLFRPDERSAKNDATVRLLSVARLIEPKGLEYLLAACNILKARGYLVQCNIIGARATNEANYALRLQKLRRTLGLEQEVRFLGAQPFTSVLMQYKEADIFVLPSVITSDGRGDVTPNVVIEAMAMKLPVVSTWVRGIPEIIENEVSGLLVPPGDSAALAQAIIRLRENPKLRITLGNNAQKRVAEQFDIHHNIKTFVELFHSEG